MSKAGELDWSDFNKTEEKYEHKQTALWVNTPGVGIAPKMDGAEPTLKKGEIPRKPTNEEIASYILKGTQTGGQAQWKDSEHLSKEIVSQEQAEELQKNWNNSINDFYKVANKPVNPNSKESNWGSGKSFNSTLTEEERFKRNMDVSRDEGE